jgi:hypothetical protein
MHCIKLFQLVFCLFWFNRNTKTLCFSIDAKKPKQMFFFLVSGDVYKLKK